MRALGSYLRCGATTAGCLLALAAIAQTLSPDEVRVRSGPYRPSPTALHVQSNEVQVGVVVRDAKGHAVRALNQGDFTIEEDGKKQAISTFSIETRDLHTGTDARLPNPTQPAAQTQVQEQSRQRPRYVALYFDDLHTKSGDMGHVRNAAENFVHTGLGAGDQIALFTTSSSETVDFTADASSILSALARLNSRARIFDAGTCPRITPQDAYLIVNHLDTEAYNVALAAAKECNCDDQANMSMTCYQQQERLVMAQAQQTWEPLKELSEDTLETIKRTVNYLATKPGERVLVLASSGFLTGTLEAQVDALIDNAIRAGVVINALDAKGLYMEDPSHGQAQNDLAANSAAGAGAFRHENESFGPSLMSLTAAMVDFVVSTGGRFFHNRNDLGAGFFSLAAAPETEYLLGFVPENTRANGAYHKLKVELNLPGKFDIQARPGYFAPAKEPDVKPTAEEGIGAEVRSSEQRSDFPMNVSEKSVTASTGGHELSVQTRVDLQKIPFERRNDRRVDTLTFVAALFDAQGQMVAGKQAEMQLALKPETFERFSKSGIIGGMSLQAPPGTYRLRVVVQEVMHGEMSATSQSVEIQ